jgi:hypothetical protein
MVWIPALNSVFEDGLVTLRLVDRDDPIVSLVVERIVALAKPGQIEAAALRDEVLRSFLRSQLQKMRSNGRWI